MEQKTQNLNQDGLRTLALVIVTGLNIMETTYPGQYESRTGPGDHPADPLWLIKWTHKYLITSMWPLDFDRTRFDQQMEGMTLVMGRTGTLGQQFFGKPVRFWNFDFKFFKTFYLAWFFLECVVLTSKNVDVIDSIMWLTWNTCLDRIHMERACISYSQCTFPNEEHIQSGFKIVFWLSQKVMIQSAHRAQNAFWNPVSETKSEEKANWSRHRTW